MAQSVNDADFDEVVLKSPIPVLVDFWADWCGPCKMLSPIIDEVAVVAGNKVKIVKVNVDNSQESASKYGITAIPTTILFENGKIKQMNTGVLPKSEYIKMLGL